MRNTLIITILFFFLRVLPQAQELTGDLPYYINYHPSDYHGYSQNWVITSNSKGLLFVGNGDGILMYNGRTWSKFLLTNSATPASFLCDENDVIWVGAQSEIGCLEPNGVSGYQYKSLTGLVNSKLREFGFVFSISKTREGVYFRTSEKIFRLVGNQLYSIPIERGSFMFDFGNRLFVYEPSHGFSQISGNKLIRAEGEIPPEMLIRKVIAVNSNLAYIVDANAGLYKATFNLNNPYKPGITAVRMPTQIDDFLVKNEVFHAVQMKNGHFGFATQRSGTIVTDESFTILYHLSKDAGVMNETHSFLYEDRTCNLWIAMDNGICKVNAQSPLSNFNDFQGIRGSVLDVVRCFNRIFVATWQGVFYQNQHADESGKNIFTAISGIQSQAWDIEKVRFDGNDYLLVATSDGVFIIDQMQRATLVSEGNFNYVKARPDKNKFVYAGGPSQIQFLDFSGNIRKPKITQVPNLESRIINAALSGNNELFVGTARDGVFVFSAVPLSGKQGETVIEMSQIKTGEGLPVADQYYVFNYKGQILVSTQSALYKIVKKDLRYTAELFDEAFMPFYGKSMFINIVQEDKAGNMWFQTNSKLSGEKSLYYAKKTSKGWQFESKPFQAFPDIEFYSVSAEDDSIVWFGSDDGVYRFNWKVNQAFKADEPFYTILHKVTINGEVVYTGVAKESGPVATGTVNFTKGNIRFDFSAGYFIHEEQVKFTYYLEGYDDDWTTPSSENYKEYANLPPGEYTFHVKAINPFGAEGIVAEYSFVVPSPWYYKWWAWAIGILLVALIIGGLITYFNRRLIKAKLRLENIVHSRTLEIQNQKKAIEIEKEKADKLLLNILPVRIAEELKATGRCQTEFYQNVSVLFTDICGFTSISEIMDPEELVSKLDEIFTHFDDICSRNKLEKIKTIGDSHMSAGGIPVRNRTHAVDATLAALEMQQFLEKMRQKNPADSIWKLRIGINTGELTAGVVGKKKFAFDIWGDTVNTASRLQDAGEPGKINVSNRTAELVSNFFDLTYRGKKPIKHKGEVDMFFVDGIKAELSVEGKRMRPNKKFWELYNELLELKFLNF